MDRSKNRTDLLAAGRKKLLQFRQKKDHRSSSSGTSGQLKSKKGSEELEQVEIAESVPQVSSSVTETKECLVDPNLVEPDAFTDAPTILTVTKLSFSQEENDSGRTIDQEQIPEESSLTVAGELDTKESGDTLGPSSGDISYQDPGTSEAEVCTARDEGNEITPDADGLAVTRTGIMEAAEENALNLTVAEEGLILAEEISTSESMGACRITNDADPISNQEWGTVSLMKEVPFLVKNHALDACETSKGFEENLVPEASPLPPDMILLTSSLDQNASSGKERPTELADVNVTETSNIKATAEENTHSIDFKVEKETFETPQEAYQELQAEAALLPPDMILLTSSLDQNASSGKERLIELADANVTETSNIKATAEENTHSFDFKVEKDTIETRQEAYQELQAEGALLPSDMILLTSSLDQNASSGKERLIELVDENVTETSNIKATAEENTHSFDFKVEKETIETRQEAYQELQAEAALLPSDMTLLTSSLDQNASSEKEQLTELAELADENVAETSNLKATAEENTRSFVVKSEKETIETHQDAYHMLKLDEEISAHVISGFFERKDNSDPVENLRTHLYLTSVAQELLLLQMNEYDPNLYDEVSQLHGLVDQCGERNVDLQKELDRYKADLEAIRSCKKDLEIDYLSAGDKIKELGNELNLSKKGYVDLTEELTECKNVLETLHIENSKFSDQILAEEEESRKLKVEMELSRVQIKELNDRISLFTNEMEDSKRDSAKLVSQLADCRFLVLSLQAENSRLMSQNISISEEMNKIKAENELLVNENMKLVDSFSDQKDQLSAALQNIAHLEGEWKETDATVEKLTEENLYLLNCLDIHQLKLKEVAFVPQVHDSFVVRRPLIEAEEILLKLEKAVVGLHNHHMSLGKMVDRASTSGVSKLIQAFESKAHLSDEVFPIEGHSSEDMNSFNQVKEEINNLRSILKHVGLDPTEKRIFTENEVESDAITLKNDEERKGIDELVMKLAEFKEYTDNIQTQLNSTSENVEETSIRLLNRVESLQKEVYEIGGSLQEFSMMKDVISLSAQKLDTCIGLGLRGSLDADSDIRVHESTDADLNLSLSVAAATKMIEDLKDKLNAAHVDNVKNLTSFEELSREYACLLEKDNAAGGLLFRIYHKLLKYVVNSPAIGEILQLPLDDFESLEAHLNNIFNELDSDIASRNKSMEDLKKQCSHLTFTADELRLLLDRKNQEFEDLEKGCLELLQKLENRETYASHAVINPMSHEHDSTNALLVHLNDLVSFVTQEHEEAMIQLTLSKNHIFEAFSSLHLLNSSESEPLHTILKRDIAPRISELLEAEKRLNSLTSEILQKENEIQCLQDNLRKSEEALKISHSEINQSEQRLLSIREKLGIAVSKGKGLVVQRDSLKQSLIEASAELEKCKNELQAKEEKLSILETKLISSEADRIEALESELSYIRNSATQFRDYFLQKDSILQKIEETVEELNFPDEFHSKDTVDKVEWLAKCVAGSTHLTPEESNSDLNRKYEELQSGFCTLAEQNDMLDQSLRERNSLVERLERAIDGINVPHQLRSLEPEDRVEWLGRKFIEVEQERESLSSRIKQIDADLMTVGYENQVLMKNLAQSELEKDKMLREISALEEKFKEKSNEVGKIETWMKKLLGLVSEVLPDQEEPSDTSSIDYDQTHLEKLVKNLVDCYKTLSLSQEKQTNLNHSFVYQEDKTVPEGQSLGESQNDEVYSSLKVMREERDAVTEKYHLQTSEMEALIRQREEERDIAVDKYQSISSELDSMTKQMNILREERERAEVKYQSLSSEFDLMAKQRDILLEEREVAVERYQSLASELVSVTEQRDILHEDREKAVEKYRSLSSEFDSMMKQKDLLLEERERDVEKYQSLSFEFDSMTKQIVLFQEERDRAAEKYQSLSSEFESMSKQISILQHQIDQEEQKSTSTREKLAVAVRKGKSLIQQRDSLKKTLEEMNSDFEGIKKELNQQVGSLMLENRQLIDALHSIDLMDEVNLVDPLQKIECIRKRIAAMDDAAKSRRAAELLFAELNEVQERADTLQEELEKTKAGRNDALSHLKHLSMKHEEERKMYIISIMELKDGMSDMWKDLLGLCDALSSVLKVDRSSLGDLSLLASVSLLDIDAMSEDGFLESDISQDDYDGLKIEYLKLAHESLRRCTKVFAQLKEKVHEHSSAVDNRNKGISETILHYETVINDQEKKINLLQKNISLMFEACKRSALELQKSESSLSLPDCFHTEGYEERETLLDEDFAGVVADSMLQFVKRFSDIQEKKEREMSREIQQKDYQVRESLAANKRFSLDLDSANELVQGLKLQIEEMKNDKKYETKIQSLMDNLAAKDQEIESLIQALDEEESQMEELQRRNQELEQIVLKNRASLESAESSRSKALTKLSKTLTRFEELHHLSENLLLEIENLQSQMQERDSEISFLRQEVARSTSDIMVKRETTKKLQYELEEVEAWMDNIVAHLGGTKVNADSQNPSRMKSTMAYLNEQIPAVASEVSELRLSGRTKDSLLHSEREKVDELTRKVQVLEVSFRERESGQTSTAKSPDLLELESVMNKRSASGSVASVARGGRRVNNEQVSVAIDMGEGNPSPDEDDDDKAHGFKSLAMSKIVPGGARPLADKIDGLWVAIERLLMRQPSMRLGLILYWVLLHALLAASI